MDNLQLVGVKHEVEQDWATSEDRIPPRKHKIRNKNNSADAEDVASSWK